MAHNPLFQDSLTQEPLTLFSLPQELRDQIWDELYTEKHHQRRTKGIQYRLRRQIPAIRLLNRQCKQEYDDRWERRTQLWITIPSPPKVIISPRYRYEQLWQKPKWARHATRVIVLLQVEPCHQVADENEADSECTGTLDLDLHLGYAKQLAEEFTRLEKATIRLCVDQRSSPLGCIQSLLQRMSDFSTLPCVEVKLHDWSGRIFEMVGQSESKSTLLARWTLDCTKR